VLDKVHIGATWQIRLNRPCAAAMRLFCQITWTTCYLYNHTTIKITSEFRNLSVTLPGMHMPLVTYLRKPAHSGWLQSVVTGIRLQQQHLLR